MNMDIDIIYNNIVCAWKEARIPLAIPSGLSFECPEVEQEIMGMDICDFSNVLANYEKESLLCFFSQEYASYYCGGYMLYGLSHWFNQNGEDNIYDPLADDLYYYLVGLRWPIREIAGKMEFRRIKAISDFMCFSQRIYSRLSLVDRTKLIFGFSSVEWDCVVMEYKGQ